MFMTFQFLFIERTGKFMIIDKGHFKEGWQVDCEARSHEERLYSQTYVQWSL